MDLAAKIRDFPAKPGVYLMRDAAGTVLYVGKAKNLRNRVKSYFAANRDSRWQVRALLERVTALDYLVTDTEKEALLLENTLIKRHRPRYNIDLRDDKTYFSLRLDPQEEFPRLTIVRQVSRDGARYFGPYASASAARDVLKQLHRLFPLRHYPLATCRRRQRPCLYHQLRQCAAPCQGLITPSAYQELVQGAILFLEGKSRSVSRLFQEKMQAAANAERYEEAARYRDLLAAIAVTTERQKVIAQGGDLDVLGMAQEGERLALALLFIRGGMLIGSRTWTVAWDGEPREAVAATLNSYYALEVFVPPEVLVPVAPEDVTPLAELLGDRRGAAVQVKVPLRGEKRQLLQLAERNAAAVLAEGAQAAARQAAVLEELQRRLDLPRPPRRLECCDISLLQGSGAVGSLVTFIDGVPAPDQYRRYRIRSVSGSDDYAMLRELLTRRFRPERRREDDPDLLVIDGGRGQLGVLCAVLADLGVEGVAAAGLAKSRVSRDARGTELQRSAERLFLPGRKNPLVLNQQGGALLLLVRLRDEAHRFAIGYHQRLQARTSLRSALADLPGVGPARQRSLLRHFGGLPGLRRATAEELAAVPGIGRAQAERLWRQLHAGDPPPETPG